MMGCLGSALNRLRCQSKSSKACELSECLDSHKCKSIPKFLVQRDDLTSPDTDFSNLVVPDNLNLTKRQLFQLIKSWQAMHRQENITKAGVEMFVGLFKTNSDLQALFQGFKHIRSDDELRSNEALEYHATLVMTTLDDAITHIDNYEFVRQLLHKAGGSHIKFEGFEPDNFMQIKEPFLEAVRVTLGDRYTDNMQTIYTIAITFILSTLVEGIKEAMETAGIKLNSKRSGLS